MDLLTITFFLSVFNTFAIGYILFKLLKIRQLSVDDIKFILSSVATIMQILRLVKNDPQILNLIGITEEALNIVKQKYRLE
jgi:nicotinamide riboside transporter PnuC